MKYYAKIVGYGSDALEFLGDPDLRYLVLFDYTVPQELAEISVLQKRKAGHGTLEVGDAFIICDKAFSITAIGSEALHTLDELGHCTLCFKGGGEAERPGCIMLDGEKMLSKYDVRVGKTIEVY